MDDIIKALTIKITADDLTGGAWSKIGAGVKEVWNNVTVLNQAWELGSRIYGTAAALLGEAVDVLTVGGEYSEARAGFEALADSYHVNGAAMVADIRDITEGTLGLKEATQAAANAVKFNFSEEQTKTIWAFAKKYSDVIGGDVLDIANSLEKSIATGSAKAAKEYGVFIEKGEQVSAVMDQLKAKTAGMGDGVFNFGDAWSGAVKSVDDAILTIKAGLNDILGADGFEQITDWFRGIMRDVEEEAPLIAQAIYVPVKDAVVAIGDLLMGPSSLASSVIDLFDIGFSQTDDMHLKIRTLVRFAGDSIYDLGELLVKVYNFAVWPYEKAQQAIRGTVNAVKGGLGMETDAATGPIFQLDTAAFEAKRAAFDAALDKTSERQNEVSRTARGAATHINKVGEAFEDAGKKAKKHDEAVKETKRTVDEAAKSYQEVSKSLGETTKTIGDVINKTQEGINQIGQTTATFIADKYDAFSFSSSGKLRELNAMMDRQRQDKQKEFEALERQASAQRELAAAMVTTASTPRKVEFSVPPNANTTELLMRELAEFLSRMSRNEGTEVQA